VTLEEGIDGGAIGVVVATTLVDGAVVIVLAAALDEVDARRVHDPRDAMYGQSQGRRVGER
jgi:hypothetical protein